MGGRPPVPSALRRQGLTTGGLPLPGAVAQAYTPDNLTTGQVGGPRERPPSKVAPVETEEDRKRREDVERQQRQWERLYGPGSNYRGGSIFSRPRSPVEREKARQAEEAADAAAVPKVPDAPPPPPDMADAINTYGTGLMRQRTKRGVRSTFLTGPHGTASRTYLGGL